MHFNHLDIPVPDVAATRDFFVTHLDFKQINPRKPGGAVAPGPRDGLAVLRDSEGAILVLSHAKSGRPPGDGFHIGFHLKDRAGVDAAFARFGAGGVALGGPPHEIRGAYLFYCEAPGPVLVEVAHWPD